MKQLLFFAICLAMSCNSSQKVASDINNEDANVDYSIRYAETITEVELKEHLYIYASDEYEGRETGEPGQKKAVEYLKAEYERLKIPAARPEKGYFQDVPLEMTELPSGSITINDNVYNLGESFLTFTKATGDFDEIVYVGYGIEEDGYSDYDQLDIDGKIILAKFGEPMNSDGTYKLSGSLEPTKWSNRSEAIGKRAAVAKAKGAKGMLFLDELNYPRYKGYFDYMKNNDGGQMTLVEDSSEFFYLVLNKQLAQTLVSDIDSNTESKSIPAKISLNLSGANQKIETENVVAIIKGSEKPDEYVVISSHLDHIGVNADGEINNGADDDGSGTVALLEIAEAFKDAADNGKSPKRSIVFLHVTGEEKGLLGSKYYTDFDPIFPLANTVANLNIDMIGRIDPKRVGERNYIYLIGSDKLSTELHDLSEEINEKYMNIELDYTYNDENDPNRFYYRSDHYNFAKNNIPIIFYFNGTHDDYHKPGDTPDKINYDLLENRTRLIFHTAWEIANRDEKLLVDKATE
ncbi:M28 family peptidase [Aurantibacter crassamenti]|uniref:M28 family metallopeptidase n=1 Tax=Aurantibacter crassamenti TaxID=1837375 RepID=UPI0019393B94|nr:M28 family metallopeptidase [Aurantibacter crassamenti]MBM1106875.1 M28 family peptidase [Aurantibacter crassamenti]